MITDELLGFMEEGDKKSAFAVLSTAMMALANVQALVSEIRKMRALLKTLNAYIRNDGQNACPVCGSGFDCEPGCQLYEAINGTRAKRPRKKRRT